MKKKISVVCGLLLVTTMFASGPGEGVESGMPSDMPSYATVNRGQSYRPPVSARITKPALPTEDGVYESPVSSASSSPATRSAGSTESIENLPGQVQGGDYRDVYDVVTQTPPPVPTSRRPTDNTSPTYTVVDETDDGIYGAVVTSPQQQPRQQSQMYDQVTGYDRAARSRLNTWMQEDPSQLTSSDMRQARVDIQQLEQEASTDPDNQGVQQAEQQALSWWQKIKKRLGFKNSSAVAPVEPVAVQAPTRVATPQTPVQNPTPVITPVRQPMPQPVVQRDTSSTQQPDTDMQQQSAGLRSGQPLRRLIPLNAASSSQPYTPLQRVILLEKQMETFVPNNTEELKAFNSDYRLVATKSGRMTQAEFLAKYTDLIAQAKDMQNQYDLLKKEVSLANQSQARLFMYNIDQKFQQTIIVMNRVLVYAESVKSKE